MNEASLHRLLMPPHPGEIYNSSALCSCGRWQFDSVNNYNLMKQYRRVLEDHTGHIRTEIQQRERDQ